MPKANESDNEAQEDGEPTPRKRSILGDVSSEEWRAMADDLARRLRGLLNDKRMSASDLAGRIWGYAPDGGGANRRESISRYLSGRSIPSSKNLALMASALGVEMREIAPWHPAVKQQGAGKTVRARSSAQIGLADLPEEIISFETKMSLRSVPGDVGRVLLTVNRVLPLDVATRILAILGEAGAKDDA